MPFYTRLLPLTLLLCALALSGLAQQYPSRLYTLRDGLPQMQIITSLLDSRGYLWLGTKNGLAKFDGEQFENYRSTDFGIRGNYIGGLAEDSRHRLWVATPYGLSCFDGAIFRPFPYPDTFPVSPPDLTIDGQDRVWVKLTDSQNVPHLYCLQNSQYVPAAQLVPALKGYLVHRHMRDRHTGRLWLLINKTNQPPDDQLAWLEGNTLRFVPFKAQAGFEPVLVQANGHVLLCETDKVGTVAFHTLPAAGPPKPLARLQNGIWQRTGTAPFGCYLNTGISGTPIAAYRPQEATLTLLEGIETSVLPNVGVNWEQGGKLYIGTEQGLLEVTDNGLRHFTTQQAPYVWSVAERPNGEMWLLNYGGPPPMRYHNGRTQPLADPALAALMARERPEGKGSWNNFYYGRAYDRDSTLYLAHTTGLLAHDRRGNWRFVDNEPIIMVWGDPATNRVITGIQGGFSIYERQRRVKKLTDSSGLFKCFYGLAATTDTEPNVYWLAGGDVARYDMAHNKLTNFTAEAGTLPVKGVMDLCRDLRGTIWMAAHTGVAYYDRKTQKIRQLAPDVLKNTAGFVGLLTDSTLAIGDLYGVYLLDLAQFYRDGRVVMRLLNHRTGFVGIEPGQTGFYKDRLGRAWITSSTVLSYIDTRRFALNPTPLRPVLRRLNGQRLPFNFADSVFALPGCQDSVRVDFEVLGDNRPTATQYAWQFDGGAWSGWQTEAHTYLTGYDGGHHTFRLKARSGGLNEATEQLATVQFRAAIPFYKSPSLRRNLPWLVVGLLMAGIVLATYLYAERRRNRQARRALAWREREALFLNAQALQAQLNTHFVFNALSPLQEMILNRQPDEAASEVARFARLIRRFLEASGQFDKDRSVFDNEISLAHELELLRGYVAFELQLYGNRITAHFDADSVDGKLNPDLIMLPPLLIQPYVENAIKHGLANKPGPGQLWVRFFGADEKLICLIEDDGIGRVAMQQLQEQTIKIYESKGTQIVRQRIDYLNQLGYAIRTETDDRRGGGTVVTLTIDRHV
jgi:hypothetical protein